jgi:hypothetical protein
MSVGAGLANLATQTGMNTNIVTIIPLAVVVTMI